MLLHLWMLFLLLPIVVFSVDDSNDFTNPLMLGYLYSAFLLVIAPYAFNGGRPPRHLINVTGRGARDHLQSEEFIYASTNELEDDEEDYYYGEEEEE